MYPIRSLTAEYYMFTQERKQNPEDVINEATKKVLDLSKDFQKSFKKASKDYKQK